MATLLKTIREALPKLASQRWPSIVLGVCLLIFVAIIARDLPNRFPAMAALKRVSAPVRENVPVEQIESLFQGSPFAGGQLPQNGKHGFYTTFFVPPPPPPTPPPDPTPPAPAPPPPPATRKLALLYQGVYQAADGTKKAFLKVDTNLQVVARGNTVAADWAIGDIALRRLTLTNSAAQTNILEFDSAKEIEIPLK